MAFPRPPLGITLDRAHRLCRACGLTDDRTDQLIDSARYSTLSRQQNIELFFGTFEDPTDAELCLPCAEAALDIPADATAQETPRQESPNEARTEHE